MAGRKSPPDNDAELAALRAGMQGCRACDLYKNATQAVPGEGNEHPTIMFVGEQPGDQEDLAGHPFVGPAGKLLDRALDELCSPGSLKTVRLVDRTRSVGHDLSSSATVGAAGSRCSKLSSTSSVARPRR